MERYFSRDGEDPFRATHWERRSAKINSDDGSAPFTMSDVMFPRGYSQTAVNIIAAKYFRKRGVGSHDGYEASFEQVTKRIAVTISDAGLRQGVFGPAADQSSVDAAQVFEDELATLLLEQRGLFNSPVLFNLGLFHYHGIKTGRGGNWAWDEDSQAPIQTVDSYTRPASSACFIQHIPDDLISIFDWITDEQRIFRFGGGSGVSLSSLRSEGERLSGGGTSSGAMAWAEVADRATGSTKSGGTCLAPHQRVYTDRGPVCVRDLADAKADFVAISYDPPSGRYKAKTARAWKAGVKRVVRVSTDKGSFEVTFDHPVKLSSGEYVLAGDLRSGQSLFACAIDTQHGHLRVHLRDGRKGKEFLHRLIASDVMRLRVDGLSVHHRDGDRLHNSPSNLEVMTQAAHAREHGLDQAAAGTHIFQREVFPKAGEANGMHSESSFWQDQQRVSEYRRKQGDILTRSGRAREMQALASEQQMLNTAFRVLNAQHSIATFEEYLAGRRAVIGRVASAKLLRKQITDRFGSHDAFVKAVSAQNHRVTSVETVGDMEVYDVEVDCPTNDDKSPSSGHNFVIWPNDEYTGSGVVVSNTRRAAAMRTMDIEHPDAVRFIEWKAAEENKARALVAAGYDVAVAVKTVSGQNSNNSIRLSDDFMRAVLEDLPWSTRRVVDGSIAETYRAVDLWKKIVRAAWECADPGVHFSTTINRWHTIPAAGAINASNPCSEYLSIDDSACNLSSLNLVKFLVRAQNGSVAFDIAGYRHAARVFFVAQEILVDLSSYPTRRIAQNAHDYRQLGLGYANLGSLLMRIGLPYDSDEGRRVAAELTAILTGEAYCTSAELASVRGAFSGYGDNREAMIGVVRMHLAATDRFTQGRSHLPAVGGTDAGVIAQTLWSAALDLGSRFGYRNSQATVLAPTGTIALAMDCDTTGIEPDFAVVRRKELAGGGFIKQTNLALEPSLQGLGYSDDQVREIVTWVVGTGRLSPCGEDGSPVHAAWLSDHGLSEADIASVLSAIEGAMDIEDAVTPVVLGSSAVHRLGLAEYVSGTSWRKGFSVLQHWGLTRQQIHSASDIIIGRMTVEGAPHLKPAHLPVFDCANRCGRTGRRFISPAGHVRMLAATQPFLSGAASKTVNLPNDATEDDIAAVYMMAWELGVKCVAVYRDKSKVFQVVGQKSDAPNAVADAATTALRTIATRTLPSRTADIIAATADEISSINAIATQALGMPTVAPGEFRDHAKAAVTARPSLLPRGARRRLPKRRGGFTQESRVGGHKIFVRTGEYPDGTLGEIFLNVSKQGGPLGSMYHAFAVALSIGLQYGVPPREFVEAFKFWRFDPQGVVTDHPRIKFSLSIVDYIARMIAVDYLGMNELAHVMPETPSEAASTAGLTTGQKFAMGALEQGASRTAAMAAAGAIDEAIGDDEDGTDPNSEIDHCSNPACPGLMRRSGKCLTCDACGTTSGGCS